MSGLAGGVAVVTGAAVGLGAALVDHAVRLGMRVALADIDAERIETRARQLREAGVEAFAQRVDVRSYDEVLAFADAVYDRWSEATVVVNNAGIELTGNIWELPVERWHQAIDINLNGVFHGVRAFVPRMIADPRPSHVVNIASVAALRTGNGTSAYSASKHGNLALTESLANELATAAPHVKATVVFPGMVRTEIWARAYSADADGVGAEAKARYTAIMADRGMPAGEAAAIIFDGVERGRRHVHTHPEQSQGYILERARQLDLDRR